jgi:hypothetical protein
MSYGSLSGVSALVPVAGTLGATSTPTSAQVTEWLAQGSARIDRALSSAGYSIPVASTATVHAELTALANLYAAAHVLIARGLDSANGEAENRSDAYIERFSSELSALASSDLSALGVSSAVSPTGVNAGRRRVRTLQLRRVDGFADLDTGEDVLE